MRKVNDKRSVAVTIKVSPSDLEKFWKGAQVLWPGAPALTRSGIILAYARAGLEILLKKKKAKG